MNTDLNTIQRELDRLSRRIRSASLSDEDKRAALNSLADVKNVIVLARHRDDNQS
jgi:hypothetical protein